MNSKRRFWLVYSTALLLLSSPAIADEQAELMESVDIDRATVSPANIGMCTYVHFEIINRSDQALHLLGLETAVATSAQLVGRIDIDRVVNMESITIPAQETLDLTTSHLSFEICGLRNSLQSGEQIEVTLDFVNWRRTVSVHVHEQPRP